MRLKRLFSLALLIFAFAGSAFAQFGKVLDRVKKASDQLAPWTEEQENAIGLASAAKLIHVMGTVDDPALTKYVSYVGTTVARQAQRSVTYHFAILDARTPDGRATVSAFALPGGFVFVTKGALDRMTDEAQLAGVLAHEVAHVDGRHLEKEVQRSKSKKWALDQGTAKIPGPAELKTLANDIVSQAFKPVNPGDEDDADRKGTQFASAAGYDSSGLKRFLEVLQQDAQNGFVTPKDTALWGATHPPISERIAKLSRTSGSSAGQQLPERFKLAMEGKPVLTAASAASPSTEAAAQPTPTPAAAAAPQQEPPKKKKRSLGDFIPK